MVAKWKIKQNPYTCHLQETSDQKHRLKVKGWKNIFNENGNEKIKLR